MITETKNEVGFLYLLVVPLGIDGNIGTIFYILVEHPNTFAIILYNLR